MLYHLLYPLADSFSVFNLFQYITFRTAAAIMTALIISFSIGPFFIRWLKKKQKEGQPIRSDGPETHFAKAGTPTMGGLMILFSSIISIMLWSDLSNPYIWIVTGVIVFFGAIGLADDYAKLTTKSHRGVPGKLRLLLEFFCAFVAVAAYLNFMEIESATGLHIPFFKELVFLWFNAPPAMVFMGDTGSLSMGAGLGAIAVIVKHELVLVIVGGLFVFETLSVVIQVASFKLTGKRVFRMAPIHHHFEKKGWSEPTVVIRFWIIAFILAMIGLSTLKLR